MGTCCKKGRQWQSMEDESQRKSFSLCQKIVCPGLGPELDSDLIRDILQQLSIFSYLVSRKRPSNLAGYQRVSRAGG